MKKNLLIGIIILFIHSTVFALPIAEITLKVTDEKGEPIEKAEAWLTFHVGKKYSKTRVEGANGLTDSNGLFTGSNRSPQHINYSANKDGYYYTNDKIRMKSISKGLFSDKWEPWNPTIEVVLKKKVNPIAMYALRLDSRFAKHLPAFPFLDRFIGYDLTAGDWVAPHGLGTHRDFLFKFEKHEVTGRADHHVTLTLAFSNEGDGIQSYYVNPKGGSQLRLPHHAPITGYKSKLVFDKHRTKTKIISGKTKKDQNYFFRVRTKKDDKGNTTSALYGKIHGSIDVGDFVGEKYPTGSVFFDYYLNPTPNDTNVEFDINKNLFTNLSDWEAVKTP